MTNREYVIENLEQFLAEDVDNSCEYCMFYKNEPCKTKGTCVDGIKKWLDTESEGE